MSDPYIGEIRAFGFGFYPMGWLPCDGSSVPVSQFQTLFAVIGTLYGGNGQTTFNLPNLNGNVMLGAGQGPGLSSYTIGQAVGANTVVLTEAQMPPHSHTVTGINAAGTYATPLDGVSRLSRASTTSGVVCNAYSDQPANASMAQQALAPFGGGQPSGAANPHMNRQPYLGVYYAIATDGVFPSPA